MKLTHVLLVLCSALPGLYWSLQAAREPKDRRSISTAAGLFVLTLASTALLLLLLYWEYLI